jgi:hypothetical protein
MTIHVRSALPAAGEAKGALLITGAEGSLVSAYLAAMSGANAVIFNDAGVGLEKAGIAGVQQLDSIGMAAAAVSHLTARIGDGKDAASRGVISHVNATAAGLGVKVGMKCKQAAKILSRQAHAPRDLPPPYASWRSQLTTSAPEIVTVDSLTRLQAEDAGRIVVTGVHGGLHSGRPESALPVKALLAVFNDAGGGIDGAGYSRLPVLGDRGIAAITVYHDSARIGEGASTWKSGIISKANRVAASWGAREGAWLAEWVRGPGTDYMRRALGLN